MVLHSAITDRNVHPPVVCHCARLESHLSLQVATHQPSNLLTSNKIGRPALDSVEVALLPGHRGPSRAADGDARLTPDGHDLVWGGLPAVQTRRRA